MLHDMGVEVRDAGGNFRDFSSILSDLDVKWQKMSNTQKIATAQVVAGVHRYNDFMSLMNNYKMAVDSTTTALNSQGSATKENAIHMQTAEAKLGTLKATMEQLSYTMINSELVKGGIDFASGTLGGLNTLATKLGTLPTLILAVTSTMTLFNSKFKENLNVIGGSLIPGYSKLSNSLSNLRTELDASAKKQAENISTMKTFAMAYQQGGKSTKGMAKNIVTGKQIGRAHV